MTRVRRIEELDREELAVLVREYLLAGQLMDRAGMPHVIAEYGRDVMGQVAIDEWMGASPIYTRRTQQLLGFVGDDVETIFKGMQFDIGAPPEFMDFRYRVIDAHHGEFWLDHCGALMDVEPMGDEYVTTMCHTIEDPTFDATAWATNPRARMRPIHRPPRRPAERDPHCAWTVQIDDAADPLPAPEPVGRLMSTRLARLPVPVIHVEQGDEGWSDYTAALDPDLRAEQFSHAALVALVREIGVQTHLLSMSFLDAIGRRGSVAVAERIGRAQLTGIAGLTSQRLRDAFGWDSSLASVAQVLVVHPVFQPSGYVELRVDLDGSADSLSFRLVRCDATDEEDRVTWISLLAGGATEALDALVQGVDPHARCVPLDPGADEVVAAWRVVRGADAAPEPREVALTRFSSGADFRFRETPVHLGPDRAG